MFPRCSKIEFYCQVSQHVYRPLYVFTCKMLMMTINKQKKMTEASASVCLLLATALTMTTGEITDWHVAFNLL